MFMVIRCSFPVWGLTEMLYYLFAWGNGHDVNGYDVSIFTFAFLKIMGGVNSFRSMYIRNSFVFLFANNVA